MIKYLKYILKHKYYVAKECFRVGLYWRGITHDLSKLLPSEFIPYNRFFYGNKSVSVHLGKDVIFEEYTPLNTQKRFNLAWLTHQHRNKHHWQHWILRNDDGTTEAQEMPMEYVYEMICDWVGAGMVINGKRAEKEWYQKNKDKMVFHPRTKNLVELILGLPINF
jgi:hypothetical protein